MNDRYNQASHSEAPHRCGVQPPVEVLAADTKQDRDLDLRDPTRRTELEVTLGRISEQFATLLRQALEGHRTR